jgi:hypothetical protein
MAPCTGPRLSGDDLDGADGALAPADNQVTIVQEVFRPGNGVHVRDSLVVQVSAALGDGTASG